MSQPPPFDQDEPRRRTRPTRGRERRSAPKTESGSRPRLDGDGGVLDKLPKWAVPAGIGVIVLLVLLLVVRSCSGGGGGGDAGACLTGLAEHLPADVEVVEGTDFVQARNAGWTTDASLEEIGVALAETGVIPDPVTEKYRINRLATPEQFEGRTGLAPDDVACSLGSGTRFALSGSFDPPAVNGSQAGADADLAASEDRLGVDLGGGDPKALLEPVQGGGLATDESMIEAIERLRAGGAYSVVVQRGDGENGRALAAGIGAGGNAEERTVVLAWVYADEDAANGGRPEIVSRVNGVLQGTVSITSSDLQVDGGVVTATIPSRSAPMLQDLESVPLVDAAD